MIGYMAFGVLFDLQNIRFGYLTYINVLEEECTFQAAIEKAIKILIF